MADRGHELTDEILDGLEGQIADEYAVAVRDMEEKLQEYLRKFEKDDAIQRALLEEGKITKEEYASWRYRHTMMNKRWEQMRDVLAEDMHHTNKIALEIAHGKMPDVYALNANYGLYEIESGGKINTGLTLYNHDTAEYLLSEDRQLMPGPSTEKAAEIAANKDLQWNQKKIQSAVTQGVLQGETPFQVAKRLQTVGRMNYNAAVRYARTMTTNAQNAGRYNSYRRARDLGVQLTIEWRSVLDMRVRHEHRMMHGQRREVDEPFVVTEANGDTFEILWPGNEKCGSSTVPQSMIWNCRCTLRAWVKGFEGETVKSSPGMEGLSFEEWQNMADNDPRRKRYTNMTADAEQFDRYHRVLGSIAPKTLASFQDLKYTDEEAWKTLKQQYRIVNQYKVDSGSMTPRQILELDQRTISEKRTQFSSKYKNSGNIAGAYIDSDKGTMFFAHSAMSKSTKGYRGTSYLALLKDDRRFEYIDVLKDDGLFRRETYRDTEAKLFEYFADLYEQKPFKSITMLSERGMCDSCMGVMEQFKELYPDVQINVVSNKKVEGAVWEYRWRKKS